MSVADDRQAALIPVREQAIDSYGDEIAVAHLADGAIHAPLRPIAEQLGPVRSGRCERVRRNAGLNPELRVVCVT